MRLSARLPAGLEAAVGYTFNDPRLLARALTHRSYASEKKLGEDNQRLEFLGDAVIQVVITEHLYNLYPREREGKLTKLRSALVRKDALAAAARHIGVGDYVMMGKGEMEVEGYSRESTLCDAFEALVGAIYLDSDIDQAKAFLLPLIRDVFPDPDTLLEDMNPKGMLQEYTQKRMGGKPSYVVMDASGPDHMLTYLVEVSINGRSVATGSGSSLKSAESAAAKAALATLACPVEAPVNAETPSTQDMVSEFQYPSS